MEAPGDGLLTLQVKAGGGNGLLVKVAYWKQFLSRKLCFFCLFSPFFPRSLALSCYVCDADLTCSCGKTKGLFCLHKSVSTAITSLFIDVVPFYEKAFLHQRIQFIICELSKTLKALNITD